MHNAGEKAPYILIPHSISGIESLYWVQKYPDEVKGIIGFDMSVPQAAKNISVFPLSNVLLRASGFIGIQRMSLLYPIDYVDLDKNEMKQAKYLTFRNAFDINIRNETGSMFDNFDKIDLDKVQHVSILDFVSQDKNSIQQKDEFAKNIECKLVYLNCGHYVHQFESEQIFQKGSEFIEGLLKDNENIGGEYSGN